jgi:hypothetical protein
METSVSITGISAAKIFRICAFLLVSLFACPSFAEEDPASVSEADIQRTAPTKSDL